MDTAPVDITQPLLRSLSPRATELLLKDHTTQQPIFWATDCYSHLGQGFGFDDPLSLDYVMGGDSAIIRPRAFKTRVQQLGRTKDMAEVFTPAWICNVQNNLIDEAWFGRKGVFNTEDFEAHTWQSMQGTIAFPDGRTWMDYVRSTRLEITCGEAPYMTSRYDTTTGEFIPLPQRIGILDRKLRIVSENTHTSAEWLRAAHIALQNSLAYEWQGDSLLLARIALLVSFVEYYADKFDQPPQMRSIERALYYISWNLWQMDGLKGVVPNSCRDEVTEEENLYTITRTVTPCPGCQQKIFANHTGIPCLLRDWSKPGYPKIEFSSLLS